MEDRLERRRAGFAIVTAGLLILASFLAWAGPTASAQEANTCDDLGFPAANKVENGGTISGSWGTASWDDDEDTTLSVDMNPGWEVEICIKYGGGVQAMSFSADGVFSTGVQQGISHASWRNATQTTTSTSEPTTTSTSEPTTTSTSEPTTTSTSEPTTTTTEATTTTSQETTTTTTQPSTTTTDGQTTTTTQSSTTTTEGETTTTERTTTTTDDDDDDDDDDEETTTTTSTSTTTSEEPEAQVLGTVVTSTTVAAEVSDAEVTASTLPFTGTESEHLALLAMALLGGGILLVIGTKTIERGHSS